LTRVAAVYLVAVPSAAPLLGQGSQAPDLRARKLVDGGESVRLDGLVDEAVWLQAEVAGGFRQREPIEGALASEATEVRVVYDTATLYVGVVARTSRPDAVVARILERDAVMRVGFDGLQFAGDDAVAILLDPFHDHRSGVVFATNPHGAEFDALITDEGREYNVDWRGVWQVAARRTPEGWSAEFAIPFRSLRFPADSKTGTWGFNVCRMIRSKNEEVLLSAWGRANEGLRRVSRAGHIIGLEDLPHGGLGLETTPYVLSRVVQDPAVVGAAADPQLKMGLDAKYEIRPGLLLDLTVNTDFAQVEVDDDQVNLTRFPLFFPEKRSFFLENAGIFQFGDAGFGRPPFLLFFSRRIGIADDGEVPVIAGGRLTGRVGRQTVGVLNALTDAAFDKPRTNYAVARMKRDIGDNGFLGALVTDRRDGHSWNTAWGADGSFWPADALNVEGFFARTETSGPGGDDVAYRVAVDYQTDWLGFTGKHLYIGPDPEAGLGFIARKDMRETWGMTRLTSRPSFLGLRRLELYLNMDLITRADGLLQDWVVGTSFFPQWESGDNAFVWHGRSFTRLDEGFDLTDEVSVPAGDYDTWTLDAGFNTSPGRALTVGAFGSLQRFYDGRLVTAAGDLSLRPNANLAISLSYMHNDADVPGGAFTADVLSCRLTVAFSTQLSARMLLQYNSLDNTLSANVRVNFIHRPGSDLFLVYTERRGAEDSSLWHLSAREAAMKVTYLMRF
jgi:hypothetical protein